MLYAVGYLGVINLLAWLFTRYDKYAARTQRWRISERTLLLLAVAGGSLIMFLTMLSVRHKTRHAKFMLGIPLIIILQLAALIWFFKDSSFFSTGLSIL